MYFLCPARAACQTLIGFIAQTALGDTCKSRSIALMYAVGLS
jgi:hypothetical protein